MTGGFMLQKANKGFTLIELLISLTIVGLIAVLIFGSLRIGVRAWEKGEKDVENHQRRRIVLSLLKRQLASNSLGEVRSINQKPFAFNGDSKSMEFISHVSIMPGNQAGMVYVKYLIQPKDEDEGERFLFFEKNIVLLDKDKDLGDIDEKEFSELIPKAQSIEFEYYKYLNKEEGSQWQENWDPEVDKGHPRAVRIIFLEDEAADPIYLIARIDPETI